jgi:hypothetical protein
VFKDGPLAGGVTEANLLLTRAYNARAQLAASDLAGESEATEMRDSTERTDIELEEESFDQLVPGYFR